MITKKSLAESVIKNNPFGWTVKFIEWYPLPCLVIGGIYLQRQEDGRLTFTTTRSLSADELRVVWWIMHDAEQESDENEDTSDGT